MSIFHFREGRQTERWLYPDDAVAWNSIFGGEWRDSGRRGQMSGCPG